MYLDKFKLTAKPPLSPAGGVELAWHLPRPCSKRALKSIISDHNSDVLEAGRAELEGKGYEIGTMTARCH